MCSHVGSIGASFLKNNFVRNAHYVGFIDGSAFSNVSSISSARGNEFAFHYVVIFHS
jgi:hypothetical protein